MQNHGQLTRDGDPGFVYARALGNAQPPSLESRPLLARGQQSRRRLEQIGPDERIAALRNAAARVDFCGRIAPRGQSELRATLRDFRNRAGSSTAVTKAITVT